MIDLINTTPFKAGSALLIDLEGHDLAVAAVKATFTIPEKGKSPALSDEQTDVFSMDQVEGEPGFGIRYPADLVIGKKNTDIGIHGTVYSPKNESVKKLSAAVKVDDLYKEILVIGNRTWTKSLFRPGYTMTEPEPFVRMPLSVNRMFGGMATTKKGEKIPYEENPAGTGFVLDGNQVGGIRLPNFENPKQRIKTYRKTYAPVTLGFSLPCSAGRRGYAGTYDESWIKNRRPIPPKDMDLRFFNYAQPELVADGFLTGGERVTLANLTPEGMKTFHIPFYDIRLTFNLNGVLKTKKTRLHTLVIEPDLNRFYMTWFASEKIGKSRHHLKWTEIEHT